MKKWLATILLLITAAGTFIPCCQENDGCEGQLTYADTENKNQAEEGTCSPFFSCATCPGFVELAKLIHLIQPIVDKQVHHEMIVISDLPAYINSFWQPPRYT